MAVPHAVSRKFTVDEYYQMFDAGLFQNERVELIEGEVVRKCPQNIPHSLTVSLLTGDFVGWFAPCIVRVQLPFQVGSGSEPEPDFAVVTREQLFGAVRHPTAAQLIVEVAESSLAYDRLVKGRLYAASGVPEYWIVNLVEGRVEVYRDPRGDLYASALVLSSGESIVPVCFPEVVVPVAELLVGLR